MDNDELPREAVILPRPDRAPLTQAEYEAIMLDAVARDIAKSSVAPIDQH